MKPRRENQRPMLPQHARHCPVLEAGSALGFMVYAPLEPHESFHVAYQGEGRYRFVYYVNRKGDTPEAVFSVAVMLPVGGVGVFREEVTFMPGMPTTSREVAAHAMRCFIVPEDLGTPAGALTLRGAWNFRTPPGWDTVYTPVFNAIDRPIAPMLVVRVETDWYAHDSEFRYVLLPGEGISVAHSMPIGQALFVPRERITLQDCSEEEIAALRQSQVEFAREKAAQTVTTPYGFSYSPYYLRKSRAQSAPTDETTHEAPIRSEPTQEVAWVEKLRFPILERSEGHVPPTPAGPLARKVGRNDPCPCGSGKKYKRCHGEAS